MFPTKNLCGQRGCFQVSNNFLNFILMFSSKCSYFQLHSYVSNFILMFQVKLYFQLDIRVSKLILFLSDVFKLICVSNLLFVFRSYLFPSYISETLGMRVIIEDHVFIMVNCCAKNSELKF